MSEFDAQPPAAGSQPGGESKEQKFVRLATKRTQAALTKIRLIGNLTSSGYRYTDEQAQRVIGALRQAIDDLGAKFRKEKRGPSSGQPFAL